MPDDKEKVEKFMQSITELILKKKKKKPSS